MAVKLMVISLEIEAVGLAFVKALEELLAAIFLLGQYIRAKRLSRHR
jgi:hypothetical protein